MGHEPARYASPVVVSTASAIAHAVRAGEASPVEVAEEALRRAEAWQPVTNAFSQLHPDEALAEARKRADDLVRGGDPGPLHGVPVAVKDLFDVAGWETTGCCAAYRGRVAVRDAHAVRRLRDAGAVVIGKTNQHELAAGATNMISACGPTRNPWDPSRITGGSSGGSGAAVAAGVVPIALGSDTGGSIRIPASLCGVAGLKTSHGRLSLEGVMPLAPSMDTVGPLAETVEDAVLAFAVLAGRDRAEGPSVQEVTVGELGGDYVAYPHPEVLEAVAAAGAVFRDLGVRTVAALGAPFDPSVWEIVAWAEFARHHGRLLERREELHPRTAEYLVRGRGVTEEKAADARRRIAALREGFARALSAADVLLAPATPFTAPVAGVDEVDVGGRSLSVRRGGLSLLTRSVNLAGLPALAFPASVTADGLPVGMQLIGRPGEEETVLRIGRAFQEATDHHRREPELPEG
jgi:Asp-tRNA(Asn)/Glu-tRNA(Gln) amidotransferase A subunit family amidase